MRKFFIATLALAALVAFAGTCTITNISLTPVGSNAVFAGAVQNNSGANILQHNVKVAFLDSGNNLLEAKIVQPCLRTLPNGGTNYFSATSSYSSAQVATGLARVNFDSTFQVGTAAVGSGTISNVTVNRLGTALTVNGTFTNTDSTTLTAPNACAVVYNTSGNVVVVGLQQTMPNLSQNANSTFTVSMTVPDSTTTVSYVNIYIDGFKNGVPTLPVAQSLSNTPSLATPTPNATPGAATKLGFVVQPVPSTASPAYGVAFTTSPSVAVQDAYGVTVTSSTAAVTLGVNTPGVTVTCTNPGNLTVNAVNGIATWTGCSVSKAGVGLQLTAFSAAISPSTFSSSPFNVNAGPVASLTWTQQPGTSTSGVAFTLQPKLTELDGAGNVVWNDNSSTVTLALTTNPGGGTLTCLGGVNTDVVSAGVAVFSSCSISKVGNGEVLTGTTNAPGAIPGVAGSAFNVVPQIVFTTQPGGAAANAALAPQPVVTLRNGDGTTVTGDSASTITLTRTIVTGTGALAGCTAAVVVSSGVATFTGCNITVAGTYTLTATSNIAGTTAATSVTITIT
ncbi:MAG TPA: hypothetical protein VEZ14_02840 [Dehalococcoidia bacterium]|nr:hypothetical protein [Dehalococcoidia bacterium]